MPFLESDQRYPQYMVQEAPPSLSAHQEVYLHITGALRRKKRYEEARDETDGNTVTIPLGKKEYTIYKPKPVEGRKALQIWRGRKGESTTSPQSIVALDVLIGSDMGNLVVIYEKTKGQKEKVKRLYDVPSAKADIAHALPELFSRQRKQSKQKSSVNPLAVFRR